MGISRNLVQRMLCGDRTSFDDVVERHAEEVLRLCKLLLRDPEEARDVLQETMLRLVRTVREGRFRAMNGSIKGFLTATARNLCIDRLRQKADFQTIEDEHGWTGPELRNSCTPDRVLEETRFRAAFDQALARLTDTQRTVLVLHEVHGESHKQIGQILKINEECARSHLHDARKKMRTLLARFKDES
ncbi:MAG: RNA polymerase sigma factor [bacterium]